MLICVIISYITTVIKPFILLADEITVLGMKCVFGHHNLEMFGLKYINMSRPNFHPLEGVGHVARGNFKWMKI